MLLEAVSDSDKPSGIEINVKCGWVELVSVAVGVDNGYGEAFGV